MMALLSRLTVLVLVLAVSPAWAQFTNRPAGFVTHYDCPFSDSICGAQNPGFYTPYSSYSPGGAVSPSRSFDVNLGENANTGQGWLIIPFPGLQREAYVAVVWSPDFEGYLNNNNKLIFIRNGISDNSFLVFQGAPNASKTLKWYQQGQVDNCHLGPSGFNPGGTYPDYCWNGLYHDGTGWFEPNVSGAGTLPTTATTFHKVEIYLKASTTATSRDGIVRLWVNGTKTTEYANVNLAPEGLGEFQINSTWDGQANSTCTSDGGVRTCPRAWHHYFDHVHIALPSTSPSDTIPPSQVTGLASGAVGATTANFTWAAATDNVAVAGYNFEVCTGAGCTNFSNWANVSATSINLTGLSIGTTYLARVKAYDAAGNVSTSYSSTVSITTSSAALPTISGLTVDATGADVIWTGSPASIRVATDTIDVVEPISLFAGTPGGVTRYSRQWSPDTTFACFFARDADGNENGAPADYQCRPVTPAQTDTTPPTRSNGLPSTTLAQGTTSAVISISTDESATCKFSTLAGTAYGSMTNTMEATVSALFHSKTVSGLVDGGSYSYYVRCQDASGNQNTGDVAISFSVAAAPSDSTPPSQVTGLSVNAVSSSQIAISYAESTDNVAVTAYEIYVSSAGGSYSLAAVVAGTSATLSQLASDTLYSVKVRAKDAAGNVGAYSLVAAAQTLIADTIRPSDVSGLAVRQIDYHTLDVSWDAGTDNVGVFSTAIEQCEGPACTAFRLIATVLASSDRVIRISLLAPTTTYRFRAKHADAAGNVSEGYLETVSGTTAAVPIGTVTAICPCRHRR